MVRPRSPRLADFYATFKSRKRRAPVEASRSDMAAARRRKPPPKRAQRSLLAMRPQLPRLDLEPHHVDILALGFVAVGKWVLLDRILGAQTNNNGVIPNLTINDVLVAGGGGLIVGIVLSAITAFATLRLYVRR